MRKFLSWLILLLIVVYGAYLYFHNEKKSLVDNPTKSVPLNDKKPFINIPEDGSGKG